jgi:mannose-6-phosphate isomerase-like protein (cupin superfamily)
VSGFAVVNLAELEDVAPRFGLGYFHEARFATRPLGGSQTGLAYYRIKPGRRQPVAHRHESQEEVYVVVAGSGRVKLGTEVRPFRCWDAFRVDPETTRGFEAGADGAEILAFGVPLASAGENDAELVEDFWTD